MGGKKKKVTVGYQYSWDIHAGMGRGPVDELVAITADEKVVLATTAQEITTNTSIYIDKPDLFGGTDVSAEGGIQGWLDIMFGEADQIPGERLKGLLSGRVPGFRGIMSTFYSGLVSAFSASPKPWQYRVRRVTKGWDDGVVWYPEKACILLRNDTATLSPDFSAAQADNIRTIHAMNPAHILVQAAVSKDWGRGLSLSDDLDLEAFRTMADTLYEERFGLCFRYNRQDSVDDFIQQVLNHIGAVQYCDLTTGKLTARLIRDDYDAHTLPIFNYDNGILTIADDDSSASDNVPNEIVVTWHDPVTNTEQGVRAQNLGAIQSAGLISETRNYPALPVHDLAARVAQRDLEAGAGGLSRFTLKMDRRGSRLVPAGVFRLSLPDRHIENMVVRIGSMKEEQDGSLTVKVMEDVFGLPSTIYSSGQQPGQWLPPDFTPRPVSVQTLAETPYIVLAGSLSDAELAVLSPDSCFTSIFAVAPSGQSVNYAIVSGTDGQHYAEQGAGDFTVNVMLDNNIGPYDRPLRVTGDIALAKVGALLMIDDELMRIDAVSPGDGLLTVGRGCGDTVPVRHDAGAKVWLAEGWPDSDNIEYLPGEKVYVQLLTNTSGGQLASSLATPMTLQMTGRQGRPYPPGKVLIDGEHRLVTGTAFTLSWAHRDRLIQGNNAVSHDEGNTGPEPGTEYVITLLKGGKALRSARTTENEWIYPDESFNEGEQFDTLTLYSERDGLLSWQGYTFNQS